VSDRLEAWLRRHRYRNYQLYSRTQTTRYHFWEFLCSLRGLDDLPTVIAESALDWESGES
jgi:hypothetical protein